MADVPGRALVPIYTYIYIYIYSDRGPLGWGGGWVVGWYRVSLGLVKGWLTVD